MAEATEAKRTVPTTGCDSEILDPYCNDIYSEPTATVNNNDLIPFSCSLTAAQHANLKRLSKDTRIPMNIYIRNAVERLLVESRNLAVGGARTATR